MTIHVFTNSVGVRLGPNDDESVVNANFCSMIGGVAHFAEFATELLFLLRKTEMGEGDIAAFNVGINDCIYRKDKVVQTKLFNKIRERAIKHSDLLTQKYAENALYTICHKADDELFRFLTPDEFYAMVSEMCRLVSRGIVLSVVRFDKSSKRIGYAYNEVLNVNSVLRDVAEEHQFPYIDLFDCDPAPETSGDDVHLARRGHQLVADKINKVIESL